MLKPEEINKLKESFDGFSNQLKLINYTLSKVEKGVRKTNSFLKNKKSWPDESNSELYSTVKKFGDHVEQLSKDIKTLSSCFEFMNDLDI